MSLRDEITAEWKTRESLRGQFPQSWYANDTADLPLTMIDADIGGCIHTYVHYLKPWEVLDEERLVILGECREMLLKARPLITDDSGVRLLELNLRMASMVLTACHVCFSEDKQFLHDKKMSVREEIAACWNKMQNLRMPSSWKSDMTEILPLAFLDSCVAGCVCTYVGLEPGKRLDEERIEDLTACRNRLMEARSSLTDDEGKCCLELYLHTTNLVLAECGVSLPSEK